MVMRQRGVLIFAAISVVLTADTASEKTRARAWDALRSKVKNEEVLNHSLGVEAMMREMARTKPENDAEEWALAGLLHDIDIATTDNNLSVHGVAGARMLRDLGFSEAVAYAVSAHDDHTGIARKSRMDHALYCADQVYWKIMGTGLSFPSAAIKSAAPASVWQQVQKGRSANALARLSGECAAGGLTMTQAFEAAIAGLRKAMSSLEDRPGN
jgi:putative nucleotidyltransferase with HDIG domain